jgi:16S rRNA (guanine966-N2)-methyltransferase
MLQSRLGSFEGLKVADLFAGTGALGLEALSRGAAHCIFVEKHRPALDAVERSIARLGARERADIRAQSIEHAALPPCDVIFMDPPYGRGLAQVALDRTVGWLAPGGWAALETHGEEIDVPTGLTLVAERRFGKATVMLLRAS